MGQIIAPIRSGQKQETCGNKNFSICIHSMYPFLSNFSAEAKRAKTKPSPLKNEYICMLLKKTGPKG